MQKVSEIQSRTDERDQVVLHPHAEEVHTVGVWHHPPEAHHHHNNNSVGFIE